MSRDGHKEGEGMKAATEREKLNLVLKPLLLSCVDDIT